MNITITINCDSAAFEESASAETARILRELADKVVMLDLNESYDRYDRYLELRDIDGNTVGAMEAVGKR